MSHYSCILCFVIHTLISINQLRAEVNFTEYTRPLQHHFHPRRRFAHALRRGLVHPGHTADDGTTGVFLYEGLGCGVGVPGDDDAQDGDVAPAQALYGRQGMVDAAQVVLGNGQCQSNSIFFQISFSSGHTKVPVV